MKVSEIQVSDIVSYARIEEGEYTTEAIENLISIAKLFISNYTGIPVTATETAIKCLDDYADFVIVVYVLCQDMLDNRSLYVDKTNLNKVVDAILGMHCVNLL